MVTAATAFSLFLVWLSSLFSSNPKHYLLSLSRYYTKPATAPLIPSDLSEFIERNLAVWGIPGVAFAVVHDGEIQVQALGNRSEIGHKMTSDVSTESNLLWDAQNRCIKHLY